MTGGSSPKSFHVTTLGSQDIPALRSASHFRTYFEHHHHDNRGSIRLCPVVTSILRFDWVFFLATTINLRNQWSFQRSPIPVWRPYLFAATSLPSHCTEEPAPRHIKPTFVVHELHRVDVAFPATGHLQMAGKYVHSNPKVSAHRVISQLGRSLIARVISVAQGGIHPFKQQFLDESIVFLSQHHHLTELSGVPQVQETRQNGSRQICPKNLVPKQKGHYSCLFEKNYPGKRPQTVYYRGFMCR